MPNTKIKDIQHVTGLVERPAPLGVASIAPYLGALTDADLPESYIIPAFRHWFDANFEVIPEKVNTLPDLHEMMRNQGHIDSCTGMGFSLDKSAIEGKEISARDGWARTKEIDASWGYPLSAYGATAWAAAEAYVRGVASEALVPSGVSGYTRERYMTQDYLTPAILADRERNAGTKAYAVERTDIRRAIYTLGQAVVTYCNWYTGDNDIGRGGRSRRMTMPSGASAGGHMFGCIGWIKGELVFPNSWGKAWGWNGMFTIEYASSVFARLGQGFVHVDKEKANLADLLAKFDGKVVRVPSSPDFYKCELGVLRKFPDEICFWAHGHIFDHGIYAITTQELAAIPRGVDMRIEDAPYTTRELVRQIRMSLGAR